jgi:hypothetical protein
MASVPQDGHRLGNELSWFLLNTYATYSLGSLQVGCQDQIEE